MTFRKIILWLHRWVGLVAGGVILVLAGTGALMVWEHELDAALNPQLLRATPNTSRVSLDTLVARFREQHPREGRAIGGIKLPDHPGDTLRMLAGGGRMFSFDPATGEQLGSRPAREGFMRRVTELHLKLMLGSTGAWMVGLATALTLGLAVSGLWLWWPLRIVWFNGRLAFRRFNFELHSIAGLYSSVFLLIVAFTGVTMSFASTFDPWIRQVTGNAPPPRPPWVEPQPDAPRIALDDVVRLAEAALPGATVVSFSPPFNPRGTFRVQLRFPEDHTPGGRSIVHVHPFTGEALQVHGTRGIGAGNWYIHFSHSLHTGELWGLPTQLLALFVCLALLAQIISGVILWWKPRAVPPPDNIRA